MILGRRLRVFTLTEMLVVIAIISMLASMLMPALRKALASSRQAVCGNNLKQIGASMLMYAEDNSGFLPPVIESTTATTWYTNWGGNKGLLIPYLGTQFGKGSVFLCPANDNSYWGLLNYLANITIMGGLGNPALRVSALKRPSRNCLVLDASTILGNSWPGYWVSNTASYGSATLYPSPHGNGLMHSAVYADGHAKMVTNLQPSTELKVY